MNIRSILFFIILLAQSIDAYIIQDIQDTCLKKI